MVLGVFHQCFRNVDATEHAVKNFRKYNDGPYTLICDGGNKDHSEVFSDIAEKYNCDYHYFEWNLGLKDGSQPGGEYGWNKKESLEWLRRFKIACENGKCDHIIMMEDDVYTMNRLDVDSEVEFSGLNVHNQFRPEFVDYLTEKYNAKFNYDWYGTPGGSIFKVDTFLKNYDRIVDIFEKDFDNIKENYCPVIGWPDALMTVYYYMCGKNYTISSHLTEVHRNSNWNNGEYAMVHGYKEIYKHPRYA
jgi:hypothetical protein